uniref:ubiquitinyl hydrolase 1 n=3 Tax=Callorhinchus milii TaxID=7868 RepID=A0A4W3J9P4_CALMI
MQKGCRKYFGQKSLSEVTMDEYLSSQGLYRKLTAKDGSCLFRAVSEQLFLTQIHHLEIRRMCITYMRVNPSKFEAFVDGSLEKRLERLEDPKEWASVLEISALSLMYKCDFHVYRYPGKPPTQVTDNGFEKKILLCCSSNGHYDSVFTKQFHGAAATCQAVVYEILYRDVFGVSEEELTAAVELFRSHSKKTRRENISQTSEEPENSEKEARKDQAESSDHENAPKDKPSKPGAVDVKTTDGPSKMPFPFKVLKALDSEIYRNVEFDVWLDSRKEQQKVDYMMVSGRQYCLGDKCQVKLDQGEKYYNAHIQEAGQDGNSVTVFIEELAEKHTVPLINLKPVTQVTPVPAWNMMPNRKGGNYQKMPSGYVSELDLDPKSRKRFIKKIRGKEIFMAFAYGRGQALLPPRLQHNAPPGRGPLPPPQNPNFVQYDHPPPSRAGRSSYGPSRNQAGRFMNQRGFVNPDYTCAYSGCGKRGYQHYDNFTYRSRRNRRPVQYVNKDCQYSYIPENPQEQRAIEETMGFYQIEEGNEPGYHPLHEHSASHPVVPALPGYWVPRRGSPGSGSKPINSSEEAEERGDGGEYHEDFIYAAADPVYSDPDVYATAESTANLSIQEETSGAEPPQEGQLGNHFAYSQQVIGSVPVASTGVSAVPMAGFSHSAESCQTTMTFSNASQQPGMSPILVSPQPVGRPGPANGMGEPLSPPVLPPYSFDPNGNDLPQDKKVVQYYFNLGLQCCSQSYWQSVYVQQPPAAQDIYSPFPGPPQPTDHSPMSQLYGEVGRSEEHHSPVDSVGNGSYLAAEPQPLPHTTVYYPVLTDPCIQTSMSTYDPCIPVAPTFHYMGPWYPVNQMQNNSSPLQAMSCPAPPPPQMNYTPTGQPQPPNYVPH